MEDHETLCVKPLKHWILDFGFGIISMESVAVSVVGGVYFFSDSTNFCKCNIPIKTELYKHPIFTGI